MAGDWADYLPPKQRKLREQRRFQRRIIDKLLKRKMLISYLIVLYVCLCFCLLIAKMVFAFTLSILPLFFVPPIIYLAWWLVWKEFNE